MISSIVRTGQFIRRHPVGRTQMGKAFWRFAKWQIRSRLSRSEIAVPWIEGLALVAKNGMTGATGNIYCGLHEFGDMAFLLHFLAGTQSTEPLRFVDVGANVGAYTLLASGICRVTSIAIEPAPQAFDALRRNVEENGLEQIVDLRNVAVGEANGVIRFSVDRDTMNCVVNEEYPGVSRAVPVESLDAIIDGQCPVMIKMDVEGYEEHVIRGASHVLRSASLMAVLLETNSASVQDIMARSGFANVGYNANTRTILASADVEDNQIVNALWIKDVDEVQRACQRSPNFDVFGYRI